MTRAAKIYEYPLAANQTVIIPVDGGFYKLLAATGDVQISRNGNTGLRPLLPGQGERENFKTLTITDLSGAANNVEIIVADNNFVDDRIYGNVQVIDGGRLLTMTDAAYVGSAFVGASVGNYSAGQLWNPAGNTKWASISRVICSSSTANPVFELRPHNAALTTLGNIPQPKRVLTGSSNSTMQVRRDQTVAIVGGSVIGVVLGAARSIWPFDFKEPVILPPGQGLILVNSTANADIAVNFDFYEFTP
jgi:hypothetical protein